MIDVDFLKFSNIRQLIKIEKFFIFFGLILVAALIIFYILPALEVVRNLNARILSIEKESATATQILKDFEQLKENIGSHKNDIEKLSFLTFPEERVNPIYQYFNDLASDNGLLSTKFLIGNSEKIKGMSSISRKTFALEFVSSYEALKNFLSATESSIRLSEPLNLSISLLKEGEEPGLLNINLQIGVYTK